MLPLIKEELKLHQHPRNCYICGIWQKRATSKNYQTIRDHCHYTGKDRSTVHGICNLSFNVPNEIPEVFHNSSNYDYHFFVK